MDHDEKGAQYFHGRHQELMGAISLTFQRCGDKGAKICRQINWISHSMCYVMYILYVAVLQQRSSGVLLKIEVGIL